MVRNLQQVLDAIQSGQSYVYAQGGGIGDRGAIRIAQALRENVTLKFLALRNNSIGPAGASAISQALHRNTTLEELDLWSNCIEDAGAHSVAELLRVNSTIRVLYLNCNHLGDSGLQRLLEVLRENTVLQKLHICSSTFDQSSITALCQVLELNTTLRVLDLSVCRLGDAGVIAISQALQNNATVTHLDLSANRVGDVGSQALAEVDSLLKRNKAKYIMQVNFALGEVEVATQVLVYLPSGAEVLRIPLESGLTLLELAKLVARLRGAQVDEFRWVFPEGRLAASLDVRLEDFCPAPLLTNIVATLRESEAQTEVFQTAPREHDRSACSLEQHGVPGGSDLSPGRMQGPDGFSAACTAPAAVP